MSEDLKAELVEARNAAAHARLIAEAGPSITYPSQGSAQRVRGALTACADQIDRLLASGVVAEQRADPDEELEYAQRLATVAAQKCDCVPEWRPLDDMMGVLSQIDNALTGLVLRRDAPGDLTAEADRWIDNAYRKPHRHEEEEQYPFRFTRCNMQVAYRAGYEAAPVEAEQRAVGVDREKLVEEAQKAGRECNRYGRRSPDDYAEGMIDAILPLLQSARPTPWQAPVGWKLVPETPTEAMLESGVAQMRHTRDAGGGFGYSLETAWRALLNDAPEPPTEIAKALNAASGLGDGS